MKVIIFHEYFNKILLDNLIQKPNKSTNTKNKKVFHSHTIKNKNQIFSNSKEELTKIDFIDDIIKRFSEHFINIKTNQILEALKINSFDIFDTFSYLTSPDEFKRNLI